MPRPSGISVKAIGLLAAALLTLIFGIVIWISISSTPTPTSTNLFPADPDEIPDITDTQTGGAMFITMVDKNDPTRIAGTLKANRFEPIGEGRRRLDQPESWVYLKDGGAVKITADAATMLMPDPNEPPESGTLEGNIRIETYDSTPAPGTPAGSDATPAMTARFVEPVEFERRYLRLRSKGRFEIESDQFEFSGTDLTVILNELRDRVELVDVVQGDRLVIHTKATTSASTSVSTSASAQTTEPTRPDQAARSSQPGGDAQTPKRTANQSSIPSPSLFTRYHIVLDDQVNAAIASSGSATGDRLELWAALIGGSLPDQAIKPITLNQPTQEPVSSPAKPSPRASGSPATPSDKPTLRASTTKTGDTGEIVITWAGKMTIRPLDAQTPDELPDELVNNHLTLKLAANEGSGVTFAMPQRNFTGQGYSMTYRATQARLTLESKQTLPGIIKLEAQDVGTLVATKLDADLDTGIITLDQRGKIAIASDDPSAPDAGASIQWTNSAKLTLAKDKPTNALTDRLTNAHFEGSVIAKQSGNSVGARILDARLNPELPSANALKTLTLTDGVLSSASKSLLTGSTVKIDFVPGSAGDPIDPIRLEASGQVLGRNPESMLKADRLVVTLQRDLTNEIVVRTADAQGDIRYTGVDRTTAQGVALAADGLNETMTLLGTAAQPARVTQGGSRVTGAQININASTKAIEVPAAGSFDHDIALDDQQTDQTLGTSKPVIKGHIRATWEGSMRFDDALGLIVCEREVRVVSTPDAYTRDTLTAHRAQINLTPMPTSDPIAGTSHSTKDRQLLGARITGYAPFNQDPIPAKIESRTYDQNDPERVISLIYLEGSEILADNQSQTLAVPVPGTLLILDRAESQPQSQSDTPNDQPESVQSPSAPGLTRFTWQGDMQLDRAQGDATFTDRVIVRQKTIATGATAQLETDSLVAKFEIGTQTENQTENRSEDLNPTQSTRLLSADATGAVRFLFTGKELLADSAIYNAIDDSLFASALGNKLVTLYDESQPAPLSARTMKWNLGIDRIEINAPTPSRAPTSTP